ncbi:dynein axonemal assembly factor 8 [Erythrolamprus reginae]|uniref:dynein axonemal assembly factor 8 n=1 Tax=Erythrolamprus reginae TaxID=121349 RepID=UPI00396CA945
MASGDGNQERGDPPAFQGIPFQWGSLLSAVQDQIPSMDSDASLADSDEDGELFLFQRDQPNLIPDLSEELEDFPLEESYFQETFSFTREPLEIWNQDLRSSAFQNESVPPSEPRGGLLLDLRPQNEEAPRQDAVSSLEFSISEQQLDEGVSRVVSGTVWDLGEGKDPPSSSPDMMPAVEISPLLMPGGSEEERRKLIETKILSKAPLRPLSGLEPQNENNEEGTAEVKKEEAVVSAERPQGLTLFRFKDIEKWDLDKVLQKLGKQSKATNWPEEVESPSLRHEHFRAVTQSKLMAKLEELSRKQSKAFFSPWKTRPPQLSSLDKCQGDSRDISVPAPIKKDLSWIPAALCVPEPPTVYIDLRDTISQKSESLADETQSLSDSSSDDEEDRQGTSQNEEEGRMDELSLASRYSKNCTGKCFLLQQLRNVRKQMSHSPAPEPNKKNPNRQQPDRTNQMKARTTRPSLKHRRQSSVTIEKIESDGGNPLLIDCATGAAKPSGELQEETKEEACSEVLPGASVKKDTEDARIIENEQKEQAKEEAMKRKFQEKLEKSKPQHSTNGKQPRAEQTPVLFHTEASYLAPISTLPISQSIESNMLLLTIGLSSCGQVKPCRQKNPIFSGLTLAAAASIYPAVVTWLLSLVSCPKEGGGHPAPFRVLGLQQTWEEETALALRACIAPADRSLTQSSSSVLKQNGTSLFYQQISTFLRQTSLLDVLWWKGQLCSHLQNQPYSFLPEIADVHLSSFATVSSDSAAAEKTFAAPAGFYWQTVETDEKYFPNDRSIGESNDAGIEVAMTLLFETLLRNPVAVHHLLQLILASGLDVCGLRLLYPQPQMLVSSTITRPSCSAPGKAAAMLALSLRGLNAQRVLQDILGPSDPQLARVTDSCSINALYCPSRAEPLAYSPRTESRVHREMCFWFGGRRPSGDGSPARDGNRPRCSFQKADGNQEKTGLQEMAADRLSATLVSTTKGDLILLASPVVPPHGYGLVISTCTQRGFVLQGVKRLQLSLRRAHRLSMSASQVKVFCPCKPSKSSRSDNHLLSQVYMHCLALLLRKENASHHTPALQKGLMSRITEKGFLQEIQSNLNSGVKPDPNLCFHVIPYAENFLQELGGDFSAVPNPCNIPLHIVASRTYPTDPELEQVVLLTFIGKDALKNAGDFLNKILTSDFGQQEAPSLVEDSSFELLGLKWLPHLTRFQAKELTPSEVGDRFWQESVKALTSRPALLCALRRTGALAGLSKILKSPSSKPSGSNLQQLMSLTPEMAFRQALLFFTEQELIGDFKRRPALRFLPPPAQDVPPRGRHIQRNHADSLFLFMQAGAQIIRTILLIKPGMWTQNLARYLRKLDREKFTLVSMKHTNLSREAVQTLTPSTFKKSSADLEAHCSHLTSGSSLVLCLQRQNAVKKLLDLLGPEDPKEAQAINQFFWRALHGHSSVQNGFYGSASYCAAVRDIRLFFPEGLPGGTTSPESQEGEAGPITADATSHFGIRKNRRLVKRENNLLGPKQPQTLEKPHLAALCQATCLILPEATRQVTGQLPPYLALLEQLTSAGFRLTGAHLAVMDEPRSSRISKILSTTKEEESIMCFHLLKGSCLVLAAERDNAVVSFTTFLSSGQNQAGLEDVIRRLLYPKTEKQAEELLCCLFDFLTCESVHQIESQAP